MASAIAGAPCQVYHSEDNISELRVRVTLGARQRAPGGAAGDEGPAAGGGAARGRAGDAAAPESAAPLESRVFGWREHVVGFHEQRSDDGAGAGGPSSEGGAAEGAARRSVAAATGPPGQRLCLFSRVLQDHHGAEDAGLRSDDEDQESAPRGCCRCGRWRGRQGRADVARELAGVAPAGMVHRPQCMQLLAAFEAPEGGWAVDGGRRHSGAVGGAGAHEVLLCELKAHHGGSALELQPPFAAASSTALPYRLELPDGSWYAYSVENVSHVPTEAERRAARDARHGFDAGAPRLRRNLAGTGFEPLGAALARLTVVGEIVSFSPEGRPQRAGGSAAARRREPEPLAASEGLEREALLRSSRAVPLWCALWRQHYYVACEVSLPCGGEWEALQGEGGDGEGGRPIYSQYASLSGCHAREEQCVFNHPLELHFAQNAPRRPPGDGPPADSLPPRLVLQLLQVDSWERHSLHGYAFVDIPQQPGEHEVEARLWRPVGTIRHQLGAKLCGTFVPLASPHLVAAADAHRRDRLPRDRSSLRAESAAGVLRLRLLVLRQVPSAAAAPSPRPRARAERPPREAGTAERAAGLRRRRRRIDASPAALRVAGHAGGPTSPPRPMSGRP